LQTNALLLFEEPENPESSSHDRDGKHEAEWEYLGEYDDAEGQLTIVLLLSLCFTMIYMIRFNDS